MILFWSLLVFAVFILSLIYFVPKLLLSERRRRKGIDRIAEENGWSIDRSRRDRLPDELVGETIFNMGDPETYASFRVSLTLSGTHRDRDFLLISRGATRYRRQEGHATTYIFTKLSDTPAFTPLFIHPKSGVMDSMLQMDAGVKKLDKSVKSVFFSKISTPAPFSDHYTLRGQRGARDHITEDVQAALLARPEMMRNPAEKWYRRFSTYPGASERYAWVDVQAAIPETLNSRLDALMDWADMIQPTAKTEASRV